MAVWAMFRVKRFPAHLPLRVNIPLFYSSLFIQCHGGSFFCNSVYHCSSWSFLLFISSIIPSFIPSFYNIHGCVFLDFLCHWFVAFPAYIPSIISSFIPSFIQHSWDCFRLFIISLIHCLSLFFLFFFRFSFLLLYNNHGDIFLHLLYCQFVAFRSSYNSHYISFWNSLYYCFW